jgi:hypothetical protein
LPIRKEICLEARKANAGKPSVKKAAQDRSWIKAANIIAKTANADTSEEIALKKIKSYG